MWSIIKEQAYWVYRTAATPFVIIHLIVEDVVFQIKANKK